MLMLEERFGEPLEELLQRLYWIEKLSLAQVAEKLGPVSGAWPKPGNNTPRQLNRSTIGKWMQALGIPRRKNTG